MSANHCDKYINYDTSTKLYDFHYFKLFFLFGVEYILFFQYNVLVA